MRTTKVPAINAATACTLAKTSASALIHLRTLYTALNSCKQKLCHTPTTTGDAPSVATIANTVLAS